MINQVECHPRLTQKELQAFCLKHGTHLDAWAPLMQGELLNYEFLTGISSKYNKSVAQVILRWDVKNDIITIPKSTIEHRIVENASVFDLN